MCLLISNFPTSKGKKGEEGKIKHATSCLDIIFGREKGERGEEQNVP